MAWKFGDLWRDITGVTAQREATSAQEAANAAAQARFDAANTQTSQTFNPYTSAGADATGQLAALTGAQGAEAQLAAMQGIGSSPMFNQIVAQGEDALLQNSAATGGVRGGNTAGLLAQYRPQMLQQQIMQQMQQLGGLANMGLGAAGQQAGIQAGFAGQQAGLEGQLGDIQAAGTLGEYNTQKGFVTDAVGMGLQLAGIPGGGLLGNLF